MSGEVIVIGQSADCDLRLLDDQYVSAHHCRLIRRPHTPVIVEDLRSTNGTWLIRGDARIQVTVPQPLYPGDVLVVGRTSIPWSTREPIRVQAEVDRG